MNRKEIVMFIKSKKFIAAAVSAAVILSSAGIVCAANSVKEEAIVESNATANVQNKKTIRSLKKTKPFTHS